MRDLESKNPPDRPLMSAETGNVEISRQDPLERALFPERRRLCSPGRLDGGRDRDRTCDPLDVNEVLSR